MTIDYKKPLLDLIKKEKQEQKKKTVESVEGLDELIKHIKLGLKTNFCCNVGTKDLPEEEIKRMEEAFTRENIIHRHDKLVNAFLCFNTQEDMDGFYKRVNERLNKNK